MGLTIHYKLTTDRTDVEEVRTLVNDFRQSALNLPFQEVGDIIEFKDDECQFEDREDPNRWLKIQSGKHVQQGEQHLHVLPIHVIAFTAISGEGSEPTNLGLARYPETVQVERHGRKQTLRTNLHGWSWGSFTKTQYASNPGCGGVANFIRCHLAIVHLLDAIQQRQLAKVEVSDEGDYWEHRDAHKLAETIGEWNDMIAAVAGEFKDAGKWAVQAPITQFPNFERLEAKGQDKLDERNS